MEVLGQKSACSADTWQSGVTPLYYVAKMQPAKTLLQKSSQMKTMVGDLFALSSWGKESAVLLERTRIGVAEAWTGSRHFTSRNWFGLLHPDPRCEFTTGCNKGAQEISSDPKWFRPHLRWRCLLDNLHPDVKARKRMSEGRSCNRLSTRI